MYEDWIELCHVIFEKRGHGRISEIKFRGKFSGPIPTAEEFILNLKTKYNASGEPQPQEKAVNELEVMNEWLSEHRNKQRSAHDENKIIQREIESSGQSLNTDPDFSELYYQGLSLFDAGDYKSAADLFGKALKINPKHKDALKYLLKSFYYVRQNNKHIAWSWAKVIWMQQEFLNIFMI